MSRASVKEKAYKDGLFAESVAAWVLRAKGYRILERRFKTPVGEIDIIARKRDMVVFIEVKARAQLSTALESITPRMRQRIEKAAHYYIAQQRGFSDHGCRFDLFAIAAPWRWRHLDNAWRPAS